MSDLEHYRTVLRRFVARRLRSPQEADDVVQEVFLRAYRTKSRGALRFPRAFLFTTARNLVIDLRRREYVRGEESRGAASEDQIEDRVAGPEEQTLVAQRMELLRRAILSLPPRCRQAFVLRKFRHLSYRSIAEQMAISEKTVEKHLAKAMVLCRRFVLGAERVRSEGVVDLAQYRRTRDGGEPSSRGEASGTIDA